MMPEADLAHRLSSKKECRKRHWNLFVYPRIQSSNRGEAMTERLNYAKAFPEGIHAVMNLERAIHASGLELPLLELVKTRASQINGCAYCIDMHTKDARAGGRNRAAALRALSLAGDAVFHAARTGRSGLG
jgi:AhpD family alkylhydroperoxidase